MIISIADSPRKGKRFRAIYRRENGKETAYDFGYKGGYTYIDGATDKTRENYWARHLANATERRLIKDVIISPATLSAYLLWGASRDIDKNLDILNFMMRNTSMD